MSSDLSVLFLDIVGFDLGAHDELGTREEFIERDDLRAMDVSAKEFQRTALINIYTVLADEFLEIANH